MLNNQTEAVDSRRDGPIPDNACAQRHDDQNVAVAGREKNCLRDDLNSRNEGDLPFHISRVISPFSGFHSVQHSLRVRAG